MEGASPILRYMESPFKKVQVVNFFGSNPNAYSTANVNFNPKIDPSLTRMGEMSREKNSFYDSHFEEDLPTFAGNPRSPQTPVSFGGHYSLAQKTQPKWPKSNPATTRLNFLVTETKGPSLLKKRTYELKSLNYFQEKSHRRDETPEMGEEDEEIYSFGDSQKKSHLDSSDNDLAKKIVCNCKNSKCLKLYCECFRAGYVCGEDCNCENCENKVECADKIRSSKEAITQRNPNAFKPRVDTAPPTAKKSIGSKNTLVILTSEEKRQHTQGCNCKKSRCAKKYCECYQSGVACGANCKCCDCTNRDPDDLNHFHGSYPPSPNFQYLSDPSSSRKRPVHYKVWTGDDTNFVHQPSYEAFSQMAESPIRQMRRFGEFEGSPPLAKEGFSDVNRRSIRSNLNFMKVDHYFPNHNDSNVSEIREEKQVPEPFMVRATDKNSSVSSNVSNKGASARNTEKSEQKRPARGSQTKEQIEAFPKRSLRSRASRCDENFVTDY